MTRLRLLRVALLAAPFAGCAPDAPVTEETERRPALEGDWDGTWRLAEGARLVQAGGALWWKQGEARHALADEMVGAPAVSADGSRVAFAHRAPGVPDALAVLDVVAWSADGPIPRRLVDSGAPDRVALSPDGDWVVYVHNATGLASVWAAPFEGGPPTQLTNAEVDWQPGQAPAGFVPPPLDGPPQVADGRVWWTGPDGVEHAVALP